MVGSNNVSRDQPWAKIDVEVAGEDGRGIGLAVGRANIGHALRRGLRRAKGRALATDAPVSVEGVQDGSIAATAEPSPHHDTLTPLVALVELERTRVQGLEDVGVDEDVDPVLLAADGDEPCSLLYEI